VRYIIPGGANVAAVNTRTHARTHTRSAPFWRHHVQHYCRVTIESAALCSSLEFIRGQVRA